MLISSIGKYITEDGKIVVVKSTDGYRRAYGKDSRGMETSWYTEDGSVRSGLMNGNRIVMKLED